MVPLIVFCADLDTAGETCCRTSPGLAFPVGGALATAAGAGLGAGALEPCRSLRALVAEGLAASAAGVSVVLAGLWVSGKVTGADETGGVEEIELAG